MHHVPSRLPTVSMLATGVRRRLRVKSGVAVPLWVPEPRQ